ncbi:quinone-dependent dihydroorotate dehydrogenase [Cumulibacter manganitolerans]|uniref:quinone-dependent dihydroorotate dehydrogenase n=1 Tax=Cumulibacter manganitolerans TaxID=1884992 RepID=UPI0012972ED9|nr:quinone-dependent dihydroorotate dehydrogenase [Cumulibacter manganitolerans]
MPSVAALAYRAARPALFSVGGGDAEAAHKWTMGRLETIDRHRPLRALTRSVCRPVSDPVSMFGVQLANRVGLAAGMAKNGEALRAWPALGFGFAEIGTVTWHAQPGNDTPRLFRLPASRAVINRMGFNNHGARALAARLRRYGDSAAALRERLGYPLGISLGKSKITPVEDAVGDYVSSLRAIRDLASYVAINVSSPNTPGLRSLQDKGFLDELVAELRDESRGVPLLVKIAPDLTHGAVDDVLDVCRERGVAGIIATNTTIGRDGIAPAERALADEAGGLSGAPLTVLARDIVRYLRAQVGSDLPIIGVGGIGSADDALAMVDAGADLVQLYSSLIFRGPAVVSETAQALKDRTA